MTFKPDRDALGGGRPRRPRRDRPDGPLGVRIMVDFTTGRVIGADRPAPTAEGPQAWPGADRGPEPPSFDAA